MTVTLGQSTFQNFNEAVDSAETTYGLDSCGAREYTLIENGDASLTQVDYARIEVINENLNFRILSDYTNEDYEGVHNLQLYVTMINYPTESDGSHPTLLSDFTLTINPATCDCSLLDWIYPDAQSLTTTVLKES